MDRRKNRPSIVPVPGEDHHPVKPNSLMRRRFGARLLVGLPVAAAVALAAGKPEIAEAGTDGDWTLTGNNLPDSTKFLGTKNAQPLIFKTNNQTRMTIRSDGTVGIGTAETWGHKLHVSSNGLAIFAEATGGNHAIFGHAASTTASGAGVYGMTANSSINQEISAGVVGSAVSTNGNAVGVYGVASGPAQTGVYGQSDAGTAVIGRSGGDGDQAGVRGISTGLQGNGVVGEATNGANAYGVWGKSSSGYAGYFDGKVHVNGTLSKSAGSFKIDHPLDPENKYLYHAFVESPDMLNIYNGTVLLDANGRAVVELPEWFEALNQDFRYQLTAIGAPAPNLHIAEKIQANRFTIAGGAPEMEISWQVTGIRHDAYAKAHRIPVEEAKPIEERGTYLHPADRGQPENKGMDRVKQLRTLPNITDQPLSVPVPNV